MLYKETVKSNLSTLSTVVTCSKRLPSRFFAVLSALPVCSLTVLWLSFLQMDVVYTFQSGQAPVPGALRRQPSVVSQHNDATAAKTLSSPTHLGLSPSSSLTNSSGAPPPPAAASSSTAGSELVMKGQHASLHHQAGVIFCA